MAGKQDKITRIKAHLEAGYDMTNPVDKKQFDKNYKNADEKVAFFVNKEVVGELKPFMKPRFEEAQALLTQLNALKPTKAAAAVPAKAPKTVAAAKAPKTAAAAATSAAKAPKTAAAAAPAAAAAAAPAAAAPAAAAPAAAAPAPLILNAPLRIKTPLWTRPSRVPSPKAPKASPPRNANNATVRASRPPIVGNNLKIKIPVKSRKRNSPKQGTRYKRLPTLPNVTINEYMERVWVNTQKQIPQMYNPFTGVAYQPQESPMDDIEKAYIILRKIRSNTVRRASLLRAKAHGKTRSNKVSPKRAVTTSLNNGANAISPLTPGSFVSQEVRRPASPPLPPIPGKLGRLTSWRIPKAARHYPVAPPPVPSRKGFLRREDAVPSEPFDTEERIGSVERGGISPIDEVNESGFNNNT